MEKCYEALCCLWLAASIKMLHILYGLWVKGELHVYAYCCSFLYISLLIIIIKHALRTFLVKNIHST